MNEFIDQITPRSILSLFDTNKEQRASFAKQMIEGVVEGNVNALDVIIQAKAMVVICETITSDTRFKEAAIAEASKYDKNGFIHHNAELKVGEFGTRYLYDNCNDKEWEQLEALARYANEKLKVRQEFLKGLPPSGLQIVDEDTGETYKIYPPIKSSVTNVSVKLK